MKSSFTGLFAQLNRFAALGLATLLVAWLSPLAMAESWGGSWGGSSGGFGGSSGGSSGGFVGGFGASSGGTGLLGGRRPIRNLLGRIGDRFHGGRAGLASHGSSGSTGGGFGSFGSHGSHGSIVSHGSSGGFYGSHGTSFVSAPIVTHGSSGGFNAMGSPAMMPYSAGYIDSAPMMMNPQNNGIATPPPADGGFQPVDGINFEGSGGAEGGSQTPMPGPGRDFNGSTRKPASATTTALTLRLPAEAKVYINDQLTRTPGEMRRYVAKNLTPGEEYHYHVKAVVVDNGVERVRTEMVTIAAGAEKTVDFDFSAAITSLTLNVPEGAKVELCGKPTLAEGTERLFSTERLSEGETWENYLVEVTLERNGKTMKQRQEIQLVGGQNHELKFELDSAGGMLAVR